MLGAIAIVLLNWARLPRRASADLTGNSSPIYGYEPMREAAMAAFREKLAAGVKTVKEERPPRLRVSEYRLTWSGGREVHAKIAWPLCSALHRAIATMPRRRLRRRKGG